MAKEKLHNPSEATSDEDHIAFALHSIDQVKEGHYKVSNISLTRTDNPDGSFTMSGSWTVSETDKSA